MATENLMLYKLIILYIINKVDFPLTNTRVSAFILDKGYTNYFNIQLSISELLDDEFIVTNTTHNNTLYEITEQGKETLSLFSNLISPAIKEDINSYLIEHKYALRNEVSTMADYYQVKKDEYMVTLKVIENGSSIIELNLEIPTEDAATKICNNWKIKNSDIYSFIMSSLLEE